MVVLVINDELKVYEIGGKIIIMGHKLQYKEVNYDIVPIILPLVAYYQMFMKITSGVVK